MGLSEHHSEVGVSVWKAGVLTLAVGEHQVVQVFQLLRWRWCFDTTSRSGSEAIKTNPKFLLLRFYTEREAGKTCKKAHVNGAIAKEDGAERTKRKMETHGLTFMSPSG